MQDRILKEIKDIHANIFNLLHLLLVEFVLPVVVAEFSITICVEVSVEEMVHYKLVALIWSGS